MSIVGGMSLVFAGPAKIGLMTGTVSQGEDGVNPSG